MDRVALRKTNNVNNGGDLGQLGLCINVIFGQFYDRWRRRDSTMLVIVHRSSSFGICPSTGCAGTSSSCAPSCPSSASASPTIVCALPRWFWSGGPRGCSGPDSRDNWMPRRNSRAWVPRRPASLWTATWTCRRGTLPRGSWPFVPLPGASFLGSPPPNLCKMKIRIINC